MLKDASHRNHAHELGGTLQLGLELGGSRAINWNYGDGRRQPPLSLQSWYWSTHSRVNNSLRKWHFLTLLVSVLLPVFGFVLKYLKPKRGEGGQNAREIVKMINSNIIVKMEMNFALSPKCHFMVMNSISMKMSIEAEPQLEQHRISNEYFPTQNSYIPSPKVQNPKLKMESGKAHIRLIIWVNVTGRHKLSIRKRSPLPVSVWGQPGALARSIW